MLESEAWNGFQLLRDNRDVVKRFGEVAAVDGVDLRDRRMSLEQLDRLSRLTDKIYVHIDMDVLDPREVMAHQNKVPGGPSMANGPARSHGQGGGRALWHLHHADRVAGRVADRMQVRHRGRRAA
mgnify:CR=1 FL=1